MVTLGDILSSLDALTLVEAPKGSGVPIDDPAILDGGGDPAGVRADAIVLAVAVGAGTDEAARLVDDAADVGAAAIVFRADGATLPARLRDRAVRRGVALVAMPSDMRWEQLLRLLHVALTPSLAPSGATLGGAEDLFALADAIAVATQAAVTVEDSRWRVLAYANLDKPIDDARRQTILGRLPPTAWRTELQNAGVLERLRSADVAFRLELSGAQPRIVAPVRAGGELLGSLWLVEGDTPLGGAVCAQLERFAAIAAVHLIAHRAADDIHRRARAALVLELLDGREPAGTHAATGGHGPVLRSRGPYTVAAFGFDAPWTGDPARLLSILSLYAEDLDAEAMCAMLGGRLWALIPTPTQAGLAEFATSVIEHVERASGVRLRAGLGRSAATVADIPLSRRSAERVLEVLEAQGPGGPRLGHADDLRAKTLMLDIVSLIAELPELRDGPVARISAEDPKQVPTLRAYLDANAHAGLAAERLGVHANTVRYRVRVLRDKHGLDLDDPDARLLATLEVRVLEAGAGLG